MTAPVIIPTEEVSALAKVRALEEAIEALGWEEDTDYEARVNSESAWNILRHALARVRCGVGL